MKVDWRSSLSLVGTVVKYLAATLSIPIVTALWYGESVVPFVVTGAVALLLGFGLQQLAETKDIGVREGFLTVTLTWMVVACVGAIPYVVAESGVLASPVNALFESMSGFTTTGSTVMTEFDVHNRSVLMWRQLTQWLGGMGIVVLAIAVLPKLQSGGAQLVDAEAPGPEMEKLTPRMAETARALWKLYVALTVLEIAVLYGLHLAGYAPVMDFYNSVSHGFTSLSTGGFSPQARSVQAFSGVVQWVIIPFMFAAGINFALMWRAIRQRSLSKITDDAEFRFYTFVVVLFSVTVAVLGMTGKYAHPAGIERAAREATFQIVSVVTTTGYASVDFIEWKGAPKMVLFVAMFMGGSAGSTAGAIKAVRWLVIIKSFKREVFKSIHPESVRPMRLGNRVLDESTVKSIYAFTALYIMVFAASSVVVVIDSHRAGFPITAYDGMASVAATLGNVGPGFGQVGPMDNFVNFPWSSKMLMFALMWAGRLEIVSVLVVLSPSYWKS
ncbi:MAG: TrkH family potassium uptake protein [Halobacteria archaeon]